MGMIGTKLLPNSASQATLPGKNLGVAPTERSPSFARSGSSDLMIVRYIKLLIIIAFKLTL